MKAGRRIILALIALVGIPAFSLSAEETVFRPEDTNLPDDYVTVSIMEAYPGGHLYSLAGHLAIRMQCPYHNLDYVFSYESENSSQRIFRFLSGNLKMGLGASYTEDYLSYYRDEGRGVREYKVNMPLEARQNLWRVLDGHLSEGISLPYDYLERGCAQSTLRLLEEGLDTLTIDFGAFPEHFSLTRREITGRQIGRYSWNWAFLNLIGNKPIDDFCTYEKKIIMPADFIEVMSNATVCGKAFLEAPTEVLESKSTPKAAGFTPLHLSLILLVLTIVCAFLHKNLMLYLLLAIQTLIGLASTYLVFFSSLCCTRWSWLLIPFNILPLVFWKWRKFWRIPFGVICALWAIIFAILPHMMTDWAYVVLALALGVSYFTMTIKNPSR